VAGLLVSLGAPIVAGFQALIFVGGIAALIRFGPPSLRDMMQPGRMGHNPRWWIGAVVAATLCGVLIWAVFSANLELAPDSTFIPFGSVTSLGTALVNTDGFVVPLVVAVLLLGVALAGAARLVRRS
jgi:NADH:ubiquinone oxidoreductase subunit 6 (subunit J)